MNTSNIQIDKYLQNEMTAAESAAFENQLQYDAGLKKEMQLHLQLIVAVEHAGLKGAFAIAIRKRMFFKKAISWGIASFVICAAIILFFALNKHRYESERSYKENAMAENFVINNAADTVIETKDGVVFAIPAHAFSSSSDNVQIEIKTALNAYDIIKSGLSTMSNDELLKTAGMFYINGFVNDKPVILQKEIAVSVPATSIDPNMQLFDGMQDSTGQINWVHPKPIAKSLRTYDITTLDFYPPLYIPTVKELKKDYLNKNYTDSLYYSFSGQKYSPKIDLESTVPSPGIANDYPGTDTTPKPGLQKLPSLFISDSSYSYQIDPAIIRSIWDKKFNNTILATKEFEERLRYMHTLCTDRYLNIYLKHLDKPLYVSDSLCAKATHQYEFLSTLNKFDEFAARKDGGVMITSGMQEKLSVYFQQKYMAYEAAAKKTWAAFQDSLNKINNIADLKTKAQALADFKRDNNNFKEELCANLTDAYKQIGQQHNCGDTILPPATKYYNVTISTTGWKNLDAYVLDATQTRQSKIYTDPKTGKTAQITYNNISIQIDNAAQFDKVQVYLIPSGLSSFQRMKRESSSFTESLNALFTYDAIALGYKGKETYFLKLAVQAKAYNFNLLPTTEEVLKNAIRDYSISKSKELINEFDYQLFDEQNAIRLVQQYKDREFRERIESVIYPCGEGSWYSDSKH